MARRLAFASATLLLAWGCQLVSGLNGFAPGSAGPVGSGGRGGGTSTTGTSTTGAGASGGMGMSSSSAGGSSGQLGAPCKTVSDCESGNCVDGVCCDGVCNGPCEGCKLMAGKCAPLPSATDPKKACADQQLCEDGKCRYAAAQWAKSFGSPEKDLATAVAMDKTGIYLGGYSPADLDFGGGKLVKGNSNGEDGFVVKLDDNGNYLWGQPLYANEDQQVTDLATLPSGPLVVAGNFQTAIHFGDDTLAHALLSFDASYSRGFVATLSANDGTMIDKVALNTIGTTSSSVVAVGASAAGIAATGLFSGTIKVNNVDYSAKSGAAYVAFTDDKLAPKWFLPLGEGDGEVTPTSLAMKANGDVLVGGYYYGTIKIGAKIFKAGGYDDVFAMVLSKDGALSLFRQLGTLDYEDLGTAAGFNGDDGIAIAGQAHTFIDLGDGQPVDLVDSLFLAAYDNAGMMQWKHAYDNGFWQDSLFSNIARDAGNQLIAAGTFDQKLNFDATFKFNSTKYYTPFLARYGAGGALGWARAFPTDNDDAVLLDMTLSPNGKEAIVAGVYDSQLTIAGKPLVADGKKDMWIARLKTLVDPKN